ncbi:carboxylesterase family protein [Kribbella solani]|uniref:carboxylesterase/lipase family protein n=1 Tax=Kribbella solani TaxID=236067 RepID=UPI0029B1712C|nr:carboxylesterase family protein [Kribbella solani]MDX2968017.1 carboxylesterase family protein [Kribbella solani]MDX3002310.1 carboxylesterase family protein [Kribbella solani]
MTLANTRYGPVRGTTVDPDDRTEPNSSPGGSVGAEVLVFKGVPYAAAPVGVDRFEPPRAPEPWTRPLDATDYGPTAPQSRAEGDLADFAPRMVIPGDDYLNLNIWTPGLTGNAPVMVFIHGGSFTSGSGALSVYDGTHFARDGVVLVTINYRLGVDGFLWFGDGTPNLGLLDQIAALTWVRDNIAGFGGNPDNVTVFGESAGAMSVCTLLAMPAAEGLFHRAIAQSGAAGNTISPETARIVANRLADVLGTAPTREAIAAVPMDRLIAAQEQLSQQAAAKPRAKVWGDVARTLLPFSPVVDGDVLPAPPLDRIRAGAAANIDLLVGSNSEEARLFLVPTGVGARINLPLLYLGAALRFGLPARGVRKYRANRPGATPGDVLAAIMTDSYYRIPALRLAEAHPGTYVYEFAWRSPACNGRLGASHVVELPFVFDNLDDPATATMLGLAPPQHLADLVHKSWIDFATTGDPGWPAYTSTNRISRHFASASGTTTDDRPTERRLWANR